ncbi:hypothetical protein JTL55_35970, partial [Pseudomonas aeruginosa]|nr:hypothetical protein [Pseudomonas aeruginosa]
MVVSYRLLWQPNREPRPISLVDWSRLGHCWRYRKRDGGYVARILHCFARGWNSDSDLGIRDGEVVLMNFLLVLSPQYGPAEF